ncbi:Rieske 2Fe-2S domain-containing protein [Acidianus sulfidivorans JP7]|uniref:Rieske (2Fe-2S) protein n=1 Tax=Acidianus sulfidivorans JP7 TaxID=619593 RepID=A0A2U9INP0_9CREN|nr:Rieske (2Fe-2S) protein [Acidianus sulfidivorans]AWR97640.1 Rieske 2Fe-2S domain-containing protein [Acidianus sulfidivorans JP7]
MIIDKPNLKVGEKKKISINGKEILLIYLGADRYLGFEPYCPHLGCDLEKYGVLIREELICQCHFSHFSIVDGRPIKGASKKSIKVYKVTVNHDKLIIEE